MMPNAPDDAPLTLGDFLGRPAWPERGNPFALLRGWSGALPPGSELGYPDDGNTRSKCGSWPRGALALAWSWGPQD
jgi:hypothetical protein